MKSRRCSRTIGSKTVYALFVALRCLDSVAFFLQVIDCDRLKQMTMSRQFTGGRQSAHRWSDDTMPYQHGAYQQPAHMIDYSRTQKANQEQIYSTSCQSIKQRAPVNYDHGKYLYHMRQWTGQLPLNQQHYTPAQWHGYGAYGQANAYGMTSHGGTTAAKCSTLGADFSQRQYVSQHWLSRHVDKQHDYRSMAEAPVLSQAQCSLSAHKNPYAYDKTPTVPLQKNTLLPTCRQNGSHSNMASWHVPPMRSFQWTASATGQYNGCYADSAKKRCYDDVTDDEDEDLSQQMALSAPPTSKRLRADDAMPALIPITVVNTHKANPKPTLPCSPSKPGDSTVESHNTTKLGDTVCDIVHNDDTRIKKLPLSSPVRDPTRDNQSVIKQQPSSECARILNEVHRYSTLINELLAKLDASPDKALVAMVITKYSIAAKSNWTHYLDGLTRHQDASRLSRLGVDFVTRYLRTMADCYVELRQLLASLSPVPKSQQLNGKTSSLLSSFFGTVVPLPLLCGKSNVFYMHCSKQPCYDRSYAGAHGAADRAEKVHALDSPRVKASHARSPTCKDQQNALCAPDKAPQDECNQRPELPAVEPAHDGPQLNADTSSDSTHIALESNAEVTQEHRSQVQTSRCSTRQNDSKSKGIGYVINALACWETEGKAPVTKEMLHDLSVASGVDEKTVKRCHNACVVKQMCSSRFSGTQ